MIDELGDVVGEVASGAVELAGSVVGEVIGGALEVAADLFGGSDAPAAGGDEEAKRRAAEVETP